ncbi:MAG: hypothetical protein WC430_01855 [Patescibacteria group bacterium]
MPEEKTILVKKADGSFVKMKLSDLKSAKKQLARQPQTPASSVLPNTSLTVEPDKSFKLDINKKEEKKLESQIKKTVNLIKPKEIKKETVKFAKEDFQSPLEEKLEKEKQNSAVISSSRDNQVEKAINNFGFSVPPNLINRLRSIVQLRLKDIRGIDETRQAITRPVENGGLGLNEMQADKAIEICTKILKEERENEKKSLMVETINIPQIYKEPPVPATVGIQKNSFIKKSFEDKKTILSEKFKMGGKNEARPVIQDVIPSEFHSVGPLEEIKMVGLVDFRRLSANPKEAAGRLKQKFLNLKEESIILYMDALTIWKKSPLYIEYMKSVASSLMERRGIADGLIDKNKIQIAEIQAIVEMEQELIL